jgi:hypothetical protein
MRRIPYCALVSLAPIFAFPGFVAAAVRPAVVELFTSEGCSSCPPAELYTAELAQRGDVLALTFHVDYWDDLGWRDRFSLPQSTQRQHAYAAALHLRGVFTPQMVIDGRRSFVGNDRAAIGRDLSVPREGPRIAVALHEGALRIRLGPSSGTSTGEVVLVAYRHSATTPIGLGENAGRTINEVNVVRSIRSLGRWEGRPADYEVPIDSLPGDATDVAVLLQSAGQSSIVSAAALPLRTGSSVAVVTERRQR